MFIHGICSGYFNPLHVGHLEYLQAARRECTYLTVIVNNDEQVEVKGSRPFMCEGDRAKIVEALAVVGQVVISESDCLTVSSDITSLAGLYMRPGVKLKFFNSGDRDLKGTPEFDICTGLGVDVVILKQEKIQASSELKQALIDAHTEQFDLPSDDWQEEEK